MELVFPLLLVAAVWLLMVRPQQQRIRAQRALVASIGVGDRIMTAGGVVGTIVRLDDEFAEVEVAPGVVMTFLRAAVNRRMGDAADTTSAPDELGTGGTGTSEEGA